MLHDIKVKPSFLSCFCKKCLLSFSRNCIEIISEVKFNNKHWQSPIKGCFENTKSMQHLVWLQNAKCQCKLCGLCNCAVMARWIWPGLKNFGTGCSSKKLDILSNEKLRYFRFTLNPFDSLYIIREDLPEKTQLFFWASLPNFFALVIKMKRKWRNMFIG